MSEEFILTDENYYSSESNNKYMSVHQYLDFAGSLGKAGCEARTMAGLKGEWEEKTTDAMLVGSFVDSYFEGTLDKFKKEHPEIFMKTKGHEGELLAKYRQAEKMIARAEKDEYFMQTMSGEKQVIMTGYWAGCEWKIKMDSYIPGVAIVDLKTTTDLHKAWKVADAGFVSVPEFWGYCHQAAVYTKIVEINTGKRLPFYLSFITKDDEPELCVVAIDDMTIQHYQNEIEMNMPQILMVKNGESEPIRCGKCPYCRSTAKLKGAISMYDLINE